MRATRLMRTFWTLLVLVLLVGAVPAAAGPPSILREGEAFASQQLVAHRAEDEPGRGRPLADSPGRPIPYDASGLTGRPASMPLPNWPEQLSQSHGMYTGIPDLGQTAVYLPTVLKTYFGWNSNLSIQNLADSDMDVTVTFYAGTSVPVHQVTQQVPAYSSWFFALEGEAGLPDSFFGSAVVTSAGPIAAVDNQFNPSFDMLLTYQGFSEGSLTVYVPALYDDFYGWNSALYVQNVGDTTTTVLVDYSDGLQDVASIEPNATAAFVYASGDHDPTFSAVVTADEPVVATVSAAVDSMGFGYEAFLYGHMEMLFPITMKWFDSIHNSGIHIQNVGPSDATVTIVYEGYEGDAYAVVVPPGNTYIFYPPGEPFLPAGYLGAATITSDQPLVGIGIHTDDVTPQGDLVSVYHGYGLPSRQIRADWPERRPSFSPAPLDVEQCVPITAADYVWVPFAPIVGQEVVFTGTVAPPEATPPITFLWDFGDGITGTGQVVTHSFAAPGSYTVTLVAINCDGAGMAWVEYALEVGAVYFRDHYPHVLKNDREQHMLWNTSFNIVNLGLSDGTVTVNFYDEAGNVYTPDPLTGQVTNPFVLAAGESQFIPMAATTAALPDGRYAVVVSSDQPIAAVVWLHGETVDPAAGFESNSPVCLGEAMVFSNTTTGTLPIDYLWDFGDGITSTLEYPTHTYAAEGSYTVTLEACNVNGCDMTAAMVEVLLLPTAGFTHSVDELTVTFSNTSTWASDYLWAFGDGITSTVEHPTHTYAAEGSYTVTLRASNVCGESTVVGWVTVGLAPVAGFESNSPVCLGEVMIFSNTTTGTLPIDYLWDFDDGITSTLAYPTHTYAAEGSYTVTLEACNAFGCDTAVGPVEVVLSPTAGFTHSVDELTVTFSNTSTWASDYLWAFGDGITSTVEHPTHTYAAEGSYTVTLRASNVCGESTEVGTVTVGLAPVAGFESNSPVRLGEAMVFSNTTTGTLPIDYLWDFGDGGTSTETHPLYTYTIAATYTVVLTASSTFGESVAQQVVVIEFPRYDIYLPLVSKGWGPGAGNVP